MLVLAFALAIAMAGCSTPDPAPQEIDPLAGQAAFPVRLAGTPPALDRNSTWGTLSVHASGEPGSWLVVYRSLGVSASELDFRVDISAQAQGDGGEPLGLFMAAPQVTVDGSGTMTGDVRLFTDSSGTEVTGTFYDNQTYRMLSGENITGLFFAVGATGAWSFDASVRIGSGPMTGPDFVSNGTGAELAVGVRDQPSFVESIGGVRSDLDIQASWTHMEMFWKPLINESINPYVRKCEHSFGHGSSTCTTSGSRPDYTVFGQRVREAGSAFIDVDYVMASSTFDVAIFTMPMDETAWPPGAGDPDWLQTKREDP